MYFRAVDWKKALGKIAKMTKKTVRIDHKSVGS